MYVCFAPARLWYLSDIQLKMCTPGSLCAQWSSFFSLDNCVCVRAVQERDTERQRVDELLEMNINLEADLRHSESVPSAIHQHFLQSELDSDQELAELIG